MEPAAVPLLQDLLQRMEMEPDLTPSTLSGLSVNTDTITGHMPLTRKEHLMVLKAILHF